MNITDTPDGGEFWAWMDAYVDEPHNASYEVPDMQRAYEAGSAAAKAALADLAVERDKLQRACITLGKTITSMGDSMYAARIEDQQNGSAKAMEWIINSMPEIWDGDPGTGWDGKESAQDWVERTDAARDFNDDQPVRIASRPGPDIMTVIGPMTPCPGPANVVCAVPGAEGICGASLADGPCRAHDDAETPAT